MQVALVEIMSYLSKFIYQHEFNCKPFALLYTKQKQMVSLMVFNINVSQRYIMQQWSQYPLKDGITLDCIMTTFWSGPFSPLKVEKSYSNTRKKKWKNNYPPTKKNYKFWAHGHVKTGKQVKREKKEGVKVKCWPTPATHRPDPYSKH